MEKKSMKEVSERPEGVWRQLIFPVALTHHICY
jgi:hypothetical protein